MKRILTLFLLLILFQTVYAQNYKYAWITDLHIGYTGADLELDSIVTQINQNKDLKFLIASGDITEKGKTSELQKAKEVLDKLSIPYFIIPGNHDTKWSESAGVKFNELWGNDKFNYSVNNEVYIGINSAIPWRGGGGHIKPEDLQWLEEKVSQLKPQQKYYLFTHHPLNDDIDNWFSVSNILREKNIIAVLNGHGHKNTIGKYNGIPAVMGRSTLSKDSDSWGYTIVESNDSLMSFFEMKRDNKPKQWGQIKKTDDLKIERIDSTQFRNYSAKINLQLDLHATLSVQPVFNNGLLYTADINGIISCFDSSGTLVWDYDSFGNIYSKPAIVDGYLIAATAQGDLITLNSTTGEQLQSIGFDEGITSQLITFDYAGNKQLIFPKESDSQACVVLGTSSGKVYCYDVETLQEYWSFDKPDGMIETKPLHYGNKIVFGCWDSKVYCIDDRTGLLVWQWDEIKNFYYSPAAVWPVSDGKKVYFTSPNKTVYAIDLALGITSWKKDNYEAWESVGISDDNKLLYVKGLNDKFHVVSAKTTNWMKIVKVGYGLDTMPGEIIEANNKALLNAKNGSIYSVDRNYNFSPILFLGTSRVLGLQEVGENLFLAANMDGKVVLFSL